MSLPGSRADSESAVVRPTYAFIGPEAHAHLPPIRILAGHGMGATESISKKSLTCILDTAHARHR